MKELTKEWIAKAEKDFKVILIEMKEEEEEAIWDDICFHSQQCVEKYLKALFLENEITFEKTHDLGTLAYRSKEILPISDDLLGKLDTLSEYAVEVRYTGVDTTEEEAKEPFETCKEVRKLVRKYFGLEVVG